jgi:hypothetical protein
MEITDKFIMYQNIREQKNMSTTLKTPGWESSYFKVRKVAANFKTDELESLQDAYAMMDPGHYELQIKAIKDELELRKTSLGKELL